MLCYTWSSYACMSILYKGYITWRDFGTVPYPHRVPFVRDITLGLNHSGTCFYGLKGGKHCPNNLNLTVKITFNIVVDYTVLKNIRCQEEKV